MRKAHITPDDREDSQDLERDGHHRRGFMEMGPNLRPQPLLPIEHQENKPENI